MLQFLLFVVNELRDNFIVALKNQNIEIEEEEEDIGRKKSTNSFNSKKKSSVVTFSNYFTKSKVAKVTTGNIKYQLQLNSTGFTEFLKKSKKPMSPLHRKSAFLGVLTPEKGITLLGYLLYHFRRKVLLQFYLRRNHTVTKSMLNPQCGKPIQLPKEKEDDEEFDKKPNNEIKTVGEGLIEELILRHPYGIDEMLDSGMFQFESFVTPLRKSIVELTNLLEDGNLNVVRQNATKSELKTLKKDYTQAYDVSFTKMQPRIVKLRKQQKEALLDLKSKVGGKIKFRPMTLTRI